MLAELSVVWAKFSIMSEYNFFKSATTLVQYSLKIREFKSVFVEIWSCSSHNNPITLVPACFDNV